MTQLQSLGPPGKQSEQDEDIAGKEEAIASLERQVNTELERLGVTSHQFILVSKNSINSYFLCDSGELVHQLHGHYESGLMRDVLERIFNLLAGEKLNISRLQWITEEYQQLTLLSGTLFVVEEFCYRLRLMLKRRYNVNR